MKKIAAIALGAMLAAAPLAACATPNVGEKDLPTLPPVELPPEELPEEPPKEETEEEIPEDHVPDAEPAPLKSQYVLVLTDGLNVRSGASTSHTSLGGAEAGILLKYVRTVNGWHETYYKDRVAYVSANKDYTALVSMEQSSAAVEEVIERGLRLLGVPYVYGAVRYHDGAGNKLRNFTAQKFDCSSLMQYIFFFGADVLLNTTTRTQILQGNPVQGTLKRGDLLFFTNESRYNKTGIERVGHVALYLGGNYILHTASDYAKIEQISQKRWSYFLSARRFF